jgi:Protein of unknown function (DUF3040)
VPLSEHEQRLLEQIEQAFYADDPKFASIYQGTDVRSHYRRRVVWASVGLVIGVGLLLAGVVVNEIPIGVAGFIVMLAAVSFGVASWQRMTGHRTAAPRERVARRRTDQHPDGPRRSGEPKRSVVRRLEDRWQRRQDEQ